MYFGSLRVVNGNQYYLPTVPGQEHIKTLVMCTVAKGFREFVMLKISIADSVYYYVNELKNGQPEKIENDEEYEEVCRFIDSYLNKIKGESFGNSHS
jgi:hypothetical protein